MVNLYVTHTSAARNKLLNRVRRIREVLERALVEDGVVHGTASTHRGCQGRHGEPVEDDVRLHIVDPSQKPSSKEAESAPQLIEVLKPYLR
jgi:FrmR/RcnR family transcriptional regulator, repressor of frmRAB operon